MGKNFPTEIVLISAEFLTEIGLSTEMGLSWGSGNFVENVPDVQLSLPFSALRFPPCLLCYSGLTSTESVRVCECVCVVFLFYKSRSSLYHTKYRRLPIRYNNIFVKKRTNYFFKNEDWYISRSQAMY